MIFDKRSARKPKSLQRAFKLQTVKITHRTMINCGPDAALGQVLLIYGHIQDTRSATRSRATVGCNNNTIKSCSSTLY